MIFHIRNEIGHTYQDYTSVFNLPANLDLVLHGSFFTAIRTYYLRGGIIFIYFYGIAAGRTRHGNVGIRILLLFPDDEPPYEVSDTAEDDHAYDDNQCNHPASQHEIPLYYNGQEPKYVV